MADDELPPDVFDSDLPSAADEAEAVADDDAEEDLGHPHGCRCSRECHNALSDADLHEVQIARYALDSISASDRRAQARCGQCEQAQQPRVPLTLIPI